MLWCLEERHPEGAPDHGRDTEDISCGGIEPVEPCLQRLLDRCGNRKLLNTDRELEVTVRSPQGAALEQVAERLLEEEGIAAGPLAKELSHARRQVAARGCAHELARRLGVERAELELQEAVRVALPRPVAELPGRVFPLAPIEENERDRLVLRERKELLQQA
jgi:hypothetical protein